MRERILSALNREMPEVDFEASDTMVDDGIIDSLTITGMISALSMEFGINIPYEEINEENFNSLEALEKMIERIQKNA
ncbi:MAG: acyl carrier protein [Lachnospiraceae bacterium]|nr:acyl carrier protein [Lachnospiraceae bacterium]